MSTFFCEPGISRFNIRFFFFFFFFFNSLYFLLSTAYNHTIHPLRKSRFIINIFSHRRDALVLGTWRFPGNQRVWGFPIFGGFSGVGWAVRRGAWGERGSVI
jgi:hypothetical protein